MHFLAFLSESAARALLFGMIGFVAAWFFRRRAEAQHAIWRTILAALRVALLPTILPPSSGEFTLVRYGQVTNGRIEFGPIRRWTVLGLFPHPLREGLAPDRRH
jgi:hypothetical protein